MTVYLRASLIFLQSAHSELDSTWSYLVPFPHAVYISALINRGCISLKVNACVSRLKPCFLAFLKTQAPLSSSLIAFPYLPKLRITSLERVWIL